MKKNIILPIIVFIILAILTAGYILPYKDSIFTKTPSTPEARKTVSDYFISEMHIDPTNAAKLAKSGVDFRISKDATLTGIVGNLYYYGFIKDEESFKKLLETTRDNTPGSKDSINAGKNTIDINSDYYLNYSMTDQEIADTLLNKGKYDKNFSRYNYLFMPSGPTNVNGRLW